MSKKMETKRRILEVIKDNDLTIPELSRRLGLSRSTIGQHIDELNNAGALEKMPDAYFRKHISYKAKRSMGKDILNDAKLRWNTGNVLFEQGKFADALKEFDAAISIDPNYANAYFNKALTEVTIGDFDSAIKNLNKVFALQPKSHDAAVVMGNIEVQKKNYTKAKQWYEKALEFYPDYYEAKIRLKTLKMLKKVNASLKKSKDMEEKYRKRAESNPYAQFNEAVIEAHKGNLNNAIKKLDIVLRLQPQSTLAPVLMGIIEGKKGNAANARGWYRKARKLNHDYEVNKKRFQKLLAERWDDDALTITQL